MKCKLCGKRMTPNGTVDETWRFYKCKCGYKATKHIHSPRVVRLK
jgi:tRNA(Ile2) C34 agmatinyltransferase TiaS